jgi:hypothetical protein
MNRYATIGLGAAAVVVAILTGAQILGRPGSGTGGDPSASSAAPATAEPTSAPTPTPQAGLPEGPFVLLDGQTDDPELSHPPLTVTIPAPGWTGDGGGGILTRNSDPDPPTAQP